MWRDVRDRGRRWRVVLALPARLLGAASRAAARGLRLLACQLLVEPGVAAPPDAESRGLVPRAVAARRVTTASELVAAVKDESVGAIVVAAGTYNLTSKMSGDACDPYGDSALCIGRHLTIRAEKNGTVVLNATKQTWRVVYVGKGGRAELVGLKITGGAATNVHSLFEPSRLFFHRPVGVLAFCSQGGGLFIASGAEAHLSECVVSGNEASSVRARLSVTLHRPVGVLSALS